ncbi:MAG: GH92 family glycosyl hydrolase [Parabacteroides sp.]
MYSTKIIGGVLLWFCAALHLAAQSTIDRVNPIIGTNGMGHTFPGACQPFGLIQLNPDTDTIPHNIDGKYQPGVYAYCAGYQYKDSSIVGFSHTHFSGTGHSDLGDLLIMPTVGTLQLNPGTADNPDGGYRSRYAHETETAKPGYYEVTLADYGIKAQLTTTQRVGVHKYTYPKQSDKQHLILDLIHGIYNYDGKVLWTQLRVENDTLLTGYRITNGWARANYTYFAISFSKPIQQYGCVEKGKVDYKGGYGKFDMTHNFPDMGGRKLVTYFDFDPKAGSELEVKVALSGVSTAGALKNLQAEAASFSFDQLAAQAAKRWEQALSVIDAKGSDDQLAMLYTSLYHTMINPCVYMDVDGQYRGLDHNIHQADGFTNYTVFSVWDTYRALHPLFNLINRQVNTDIAQSMLQHCAQSVHHALPIWSHMANENWCMIGYHSVSVLADAIAKGLPIDKEKALQAMISSSTIPYYEGTKEYMEKGYVPLERSGSAGSLTLEYAYDDWTIYQTALRCGNEKVANRYKQRAANYTHVFDPAIGYARPRNNKGAFKTPFSLLSTHGEGFIEGNALNYSFYVPQDVNGLMQMMGGEASFIAKLDSLFTMHLPDAFFAETEDVTKEGLLGGYVQGNEPSHHIPFLYAWTSQPWKTQYWQREIMNKMYRNNIDGLCGNDDCGQMSAWYIFSAMGFYPVCPGTDQYVLGAPYLPYLKISLENGKDFEIRAEKVSDKNRYVKSVRLNGKIHTKGYITQEEIMQGGVLSFEMTAKPNKNRQFCGSDKPYSMNN